MSEKILFISGRCPHSKKILLGIQQYRFLKDIFRIINIDKQPYPNYVKSVPCLLVNSQLVTGETVFEYFGRLVEEKNKQEALSQTNTENSGQNSDQNSAQPSTEGECRINEDGELEGWCASGGSCDYSMISEENDDYTNRRYKIDSNYELLNNEDISIQQQVKQMEEMDSNISQNKNKFDSEFERLQQERNQVGVGITRK